MQIPLSVSPDDVHPINGSGSLGVGSSGTKSHVPAFALPDWVGDLDNG